jgi:hypothetical protein
MMIACERSARHAGPPVEERGARSRFGSTPGSTLQLGVAPRRIDLLTEIDGVSFDEGWRGRTTVEIDGLAIPVIGKAELLKNKRSTGRRKDLADVALLEGED